MGVVDQQFHDKVATLCLKLYETLPKSGKPKPNEWTTVSCVVMQVDGDMRVVALGSGSKCIGKSKMSSSGDILNDSHAEVICRRSFLRFLLDCMVNGASFLQFDESVKKYAICDGARFHFFTTHVPCGDAAIFLKAVEEDFGAVVRGPEETVEEGYEVPRKVVKIDEGGDIYRTGAKCLVGDQKRDLKEAGSSYHVLGAVRTKPGRGDPTLSVSCSDKLSRWCHLGAQGALLSLLLTEPVYFDTFTIAAKTPFCKEALERALYGRLGQVVLTHPYRQCKLAIGQSTLEFRSGKDPTRQPSDCSISWCDVSERSLEVAVEGKRQGVTKKNLHKPSSRLRICKKELFGAFVGVCELREIDFGLGEDWKAVSYGKVKKVAVGYNESWDRLRESFTVWTNKDVNLLNFGFYK